MMLYARRRFGIGTARSAALLTIFGLVSASSQSAGLAAARRAGCGEPFIVRFCFGCALVALAMWGVATEYWLLAPAMFIMGFAPGGFAVVSSLASQAVPPAQARPIIACAAH